MRLRVTAKATAEQNSEELAPNSPVESASRTISRRSADEFPLLHNLERPKSVGAIFDARGDGKVVEMQPGLLMLCESGRGEVGAIGVKPELLK